MADTQHLTPGLEKRVYDLYVAQGLPINRVCERTQQSYGKVRGILEKLKVPIRGRGTYTLRGADHPSSKLLPEDREGLEIELRAGQPHGPLAKAYGISRERVRQIAEGIGAPTGRELQILRRAERLRKKRAVRAQKAEAREAAKQARYAKWRDLWAAGKMIPEMAAELGLKSGSVSVRIVKLRKEYPEWFPKRRGE